MHFVLREVALESYRDLFPRCRMDRKGESAQAEVRSARSGSRRARQARDLRAKVLETGRVLAVTYTYSAYPMVRMARDGERGASRRLPGGFCQPLYCHSPGYCPGRGGAGRCRLSDRA